MSFAQGVASGFRGLFRLSGRARRMELFSYGLVVTLVWLGVVALLFNLWKEVPQVIVTGIPFLYMFLMLGVVWRRYQDVGQEGYLAFVLYAVLYGISVEFGFEGEEILKLVLTGIAGLLFYWLMQDGQPERNAHGPSPKYME